MPNLDPTPGGDAIAEASRSEPQRGSREEQLRAIPPVSAIVTEAIRLGSELTEDVLARAARAELENVRQALLAGESLDRPEIARRVIEAIGLLQRPRLIPVLNATGVVIHTNLGRAPVSPETAEAMRAAAAHPVPLEIDPRSNERGSRMGEIAGLLRGLTGAESALVVNNCASAVLLVLAAVASAKEVVVSRGEAVEIGGGFRVPDVLRQSGARLVEVGTTNRTYARDYAAATTEETSAYLKVHPSNFRAFGFVHSASTAELVVLAREHGLPVLEDLGSGALLDTSRFGLAPEPTLGDAIVAGADLVMASADKLLGGPQGGIIIGAASWVERVARHPLARAVRADKTALAGIAATLRHYLRGEAESRIPIWHMIAAPESEIRERVTRLGAALGQDGHAVGVEPVQATVGGGSLPGETLPSWALVVSPADGEAVDALARRLRLGDPGIFGRIEQDRLFLDLRTVLPEDDQMLLQSLRHSLGV
ncbi:MAG: L-seryl-tRNA selenium transferase [Microvirga sp.]|nr:L-seryl-tRNA selenium transferase [Microvirga sp.]